MVQMTPGVTPRRLVHMLSRYTRSDKFAAEVNGALKGNGHVSETELCEAHQIAYDVMAQERAECARRVKEAEDELRRVSRSESRVESRVVLSRLDCTIVESRPTLYLPTLSIQIRLWRRAGSGREGACVARASAVVVTVRVRSRWFVVRRSRAQSAVHREGRHSVARVLRHEVTRGHASHASHAEGLLVGLLMGLLMGLLGNGATTPPPPRLSPPSPRLRESHRATTHAYDGARARPCLSAQVREGSERETKGLRNEVARLRQDLVDEDLSDEERENEVVVVRASSASYPRCSYARSALRSAMIERGGRRRRSTRARARSRTWSKAAL